MTNENQPTIVAAPPVIAAEPDAETTVSTIAGPLPVPSTGSGAPPVKSKTGKNKLVAKHAGRGKGKRKRGGGPKGGHHGNQGRRFNSRHRG